MIQKINKKNGFGLMSNIRLCVQYIHEFSYIQHQRRHLKRESYRYFLLFTAGWTTLVIIYLDTHTKERVQSDIEDMRRYFFVIPYFYIFVQERNIEGKLMNKREGKYLQDREAREKKIKTLSETLSLHRFDSLLYI